MKGSVRRGTSIAVIPISTPDTKDQQSKSTARLSIGGTTKPAWSPLPAAVIARFPISTAAVSPSRRNRSSTEIGLFPFEGYDDKTCAVAWQSPPSFLRHRRVPAEVRISTPAGRPADGVSPKGRVPFHPSGVYRPAAIPPRLRIRLAQRHGDGWWMVDWPDAEEHFTMGVRRLTRIPVNRSTCA